MWKATPGKRDSWGNVNHWRVHLADDWWTGAAICDTRQDASDLVIARNAKIIKFAA